MVQKTCEICQKEFEAVQRKEKYCSDECYKEARRRQSHTPKQRARGARKKQRQRDSNPEHQREIVRKSRAKHHEQRLEDTRKWYEQHPDARKEQSRKYRALHPERKRKEGAEYYQANKERVYQRIKARLQANPILLQIKNSRSRAMRAKAPGKWTRKQFEELCEQVDFHCAYCHGKFGKLTPDHIIPLKRGGSNDISNIIPACGTCNYSKQDKTPLEYISRFNIFHRA